MEETAKILMNDIYDFIKSYSHEKGYPPTINQISEKLGIKEHEAKEVYEQLEQSGRIKVTRIPSKTEITFAD